jgi:hypothetical protein
VKRLVKTGTLLAKAGDSLTFVDPFTGSGILNALLTGHNGRTADPEVYAALLAHREITGRSGVGREMPILTMVVQPPNIFQIALSRGFEVGRKFSIAHPVPVELCATSHRAKTVYNLKHPTLRACFYDVTEEDCARCEHVFY